MNKINKLLNNNKGNKLPYELENPFDSFLININKLLNPIWYKLNFTPNTLTTISLLSGILSIYYLFQKRFLLGAILYLIAYFFDCADGNYARAYKMTSRFGDLYDHIADMVKMFLLFYYIYKTSDIQKKNKIVFIVLFCILGILTGLHIGCQQKVYNEKESVLNHLIKFCYDTKIISITKYFGVGTLQLFFFIYILCIPIM